MSGKLYGYGRVSTEEQNLDVQEAALKAAGCEVILLEKASGSGRDRPKLKLLLEVVGKGDTVVVSKLDRLSRNTVDMLTIINELGDKGAGFRSIAEPWADTTSPAGKLMLTVFAGVAQFERERLKERQREGIERARREGVYRGRPPTIDAAKVFDLKASGIGPSQIARELKCSEASVFRILNQGIAA